MNLKHGYVTSFIIAIVFAFALMVPTASAQCVVIWAGCGSDIGGPGNNPGGGGPGMGVPGGMGGPGGSGGQMCCHDTEASPEENGQMMQECIDAQQECLDQKCQEYREITVRTVGIYPVCPSDLGW